MKGRRGALGQYHASMSNNRGHDFEEAIRQACLLYANQGRAKVEKTPEPFRVLEKREGGIFVGRFTAHAQPDFQGTLDGGRSIIFEAKYTTTDAMKRDVLTETQMETLERHHRCGALAAVCVGIQDRFGESGDPELIYKDHGMDVDSIVAKAKALVARKG